MKARIEGGTDIATEGAWDAVLQCEPLVDRSEKMWLQDVEQAKLFLIKTGGDGGGPVDIYVDEEISAKARRRMRQVGEEHLLLVPSGRLMVGGVEDYRSANPRITGDNSIVAIPPGNYAVTCFLPKSPESSHSGLTKKQYIAALGEEDYRYFRRKTTAGLWGYVGFLLWPILGPFVGGLWAFGIALVVVILHTTIQGRLQARDARYQDVNRRVNEAFRQAEKDSDPVYVLTFRKLVDRGELKGGSVNF
jgi:hypothetical protein